MAAQQKTAAQVAQLSRASTSLLTGQVQLRTQSTVSAASASSRPSSSGPRYTGKVNGRQTTQANAPLGSQLTPNKILAHFGQKPFAIASANLLGDNAELAARAMTHESYRNAVEGHNRRLAFIGRRSLKMFATLYLHAQLQASPSSVTSSYLTKLLDSPLAIDEMLTTSRLGDKVGRSLQLEKVMKWTPNVNVSQLGPRETGLFKVRGGCVEALLGAVYHERGAQVAHQFFTTTILPILIQEIFPKPVPDFIAQQVAKPT